MKMKAASELFERFVTAKPDEYASLRRDYRQGGYSAFNELLEGLKEKLIASEEEGMGELKELVARGKDIIPDPGAISPAWEQVWEDYDKYVSFKEQALGMVKPDERDGEWQIVMDNPFTNEGIACYPGLSFAEAAYFYAYFRKDLKKTEYLRLQKVLNLIVAEGS